MIVGENTIFAIPLNGGALKEMEALIKELHVLKTIRISLFLLD